MSAGGLAALVVVAVALGLAPLAHAQDSKAARKIDDMNRTAMEDYDLLEVEVARKQLNDALAVAKRNKLEKSAAAARTHLDLGIVLGAGLSDQDAALIEFIAALQIDPTLRLEAAYRSPALQKTFDQARATVGGVRETVPGPAPAPAPSEDRGIRHTPVEESLAGQPILISVRLGAEVRAREVVLAYRPAGADSFTQLAMKAATGGELQGIIPDAATHGSALQYYLEARGATGKVLAASGSADAPHIVAIARAAGAPVAAAGDGENPLGAGGDTTTVTQAVTSVHKRFWFGFSLGSGAGYITGETEVSHQQVTCCLALAPFHLLPEFGYWLTPHLGLSLTARIGFPIGANVAGAATLAPAFIGRFSYMTGEYGGVVVHGDLGGGFIRHIIKLSATSATAAQGDTDTYATGPLFIGAGVGWNKPLGDTFHFIVDLDVLAGLPIVDTVGSGTRPTKLGFAVNADLTIGLQVAF